MIFSLHFVTDILVLVGIVTATLLAILVFIIWRVINKRNAKRRKETDRVKLAQEPNRVESFYVPYEIRKINVQSQNPSTSSEPPLPATVTTSYLNFFYHQN